jgi:hypothetical protein
VGIDVQQILTNPAVLGDVLIDSEQQYGRIFDAIQEHLYETVYLAPGVALHSSSVVPVLREQALKIAGSGFERTLLSFLAGDMQRAARSDSSSLVHVLRLAYKADLSLARELFTEARPLTEEDAWLERMGSQRKFIRISVWPFPDNRSRVVDIFVRADAPFESRIRVFTSAMMMLSRQYKDRWIAGWADEWMQDTLYSSVILSLIQSALRQLFPAVVRWEFIPNRAKSRKLAVFAPRKSSAIRHVIKVIEQLDKSNESTRRSELASIFKCLTSETAVGASYAILLCPVIGYDATGRTLLEFDGIYIQQHENDLQLVIVEAKDHAKGGQSAAFNQLKERIEKLAVGEHWHITFNVFARETSAKIKSPSFCKATFAVSIRETQ